MAGTDATASFAMDLGITGADQSKSAADALEELQEKINGSTDALAGMQKALRLLKGDVVGNAASITALKDKIAATKATAAASTAEYLKLGGSFKKAKVDTDAHAKSLEALKGVLSANGSQLSALVNGLKGMSTEMSGAALAGGGLVLVIAAIAAGVAYAAYKLTEFGLAAADARRSEELHLEGLTKLRFGYGLLGLGFGMAADKASFLQQQIDSVSSHVAIGRDQVAGYTEQLYRMGLRGGNLQAALEGISIAASAQGALGAQQFLAMAENMRFAGGSMRQLADDTKARLGGIVARQMLSLDVQSKKLRENFAFLFSGVRIEGFLNGLNKVTELFSASTESGKALKEIISTIFSPFFDLSGDAGDAFANFIEGAELEALDFLIAIFPVRKWLHDTFGDKSLWADIGGMNTLISAGSIAFDVLAFSVGAALTPIALLGALLLGVGYGIKVVGDAIGNAATAFANLDWNKAGLNIVHGIADGITTGAHWAVEAIANLGKAIIRQFEKTFDMHSPSRLMRAKAYNIGLGSAEGVDDSVPEVQRAVARARPDFADDMPIPEARAAKGGTAAASNVTISIGEINLHSGAHDSHDMVEDFTTQLVAKLQVAAIAMGAPV